MAKPVSRRRVEHRGPIDSIKSIGNTDVSRTVAFPITVGRPGLIKNIVDNEE